MAWGCNFAASGGKIGGSGKRVFTIAVVVGFHIGGESGFNAEAQRRRDAQSGENKISGALPQTPSVQSVEKSLRSSASLRLCVENKSYVEEITQTAQAILDARALYPGVTFAQMYGDKMYLFPELAAAHAANDRAVLAAYGLPPDTPEPEIVSHLMRRYQEMMNGKESNS